jgi:hypothetical protein
MPRIIEHPEFFSLQDQFAICRPVGTFSLDEAVRLIDDSLYYCKEHGIERLLANITGSLGFPSPSLTDRFWFISKWAESARGLVRLSLVVPADMILPDKIGKTFASNRGLHADAFPQENEAIEWLCSRDT